MTPEQIQAELAAMLTQPVPTGPAPVEMRPREIRSIGIVMPTEMSDEPTIEDAVLTIQTGVRNDAGRMMDGGAGTPDTVQTWELRGAAAREAVALVVDAPAVAGAFAGMPLIFAWTSQYIEEQARLAAIEATAQEPA